MNMLESILNAGDGAAVRQMGAQVGLGEAQTTAALSALVPALAAGFQNNLQDPGGLGSLLNQISGGNHAQYIDNPAMLGAPAAVEDGNGILGQIFGHKEVSREVAARAATQTGLSADVMKRLLPLAASMMMAAFARKSAQTGGGPAAMTGGGLTDMLGPLLDRNRDGSVMDDVTGMIGKFLGGKS